MSSKHYPAVGFVVEATSPTPQTREESGSTVPTLEEEPITVDQRVLVTTREYRGHYGTVTRAMKINGELVFAIAHPPFEYESMVPRHALRTLGSVLAEQGLYPVKVGDRVLGVSGKVEGFLGRVNGMNSKEDLYDITFDDPQASLWTHRRESFILIDFEDEQRASAPSPARQRTGHATILVHGQLLDLDVNSLGDEALRVGDAVVVDEGHKGVVVSGRAPEQRVGDAVLVHCLRGGDRTWVQAYAGGPGLVGNGSIVHNGRFSDQIKPGQWVLVDKTHSIILEILANS